MFLHAASVEFDHPLTGGRIPSRIPCRPTLSKFRTSEGTGGMKPVTECWCSIGMEPSWIPRRDRALHSSCSAVATGLPEPTVTEAKIGHWAGSQESIERLVSGIDHAGTDFWHALPQFLARDHETPLYEGMRELLMQLDCPNAFYGGDGQVAARTGPRAQLQRLGGPPISRAVTTHRFCHILTSERRLMAFWGGKRRSVDRHHARPGFGAQCRGRCVGGVLWRMPETLAAADPLAVVPEASMS